MAAGGGKGPGGRLGKEAVLRLLERMRDDLTPRQLERLAELAALIDEDGRIGLERALDVATPPGGGDQQRLVAFRQFRRTVAQAAQSAQVPLALASDALKRPPAHRFCWFKSDGEDPVLGGLAVMSAGKARGRRPAGALVPPRVAEMLPSGSIRVHVCAASPAADRSRARKVEEFVRGLRSSLRIGESRDIRVTATHDIETGLTVASERARLREQAHVVVALLTPAYRAEHESELAWLESRLDGYLPVAFAALPAEPGEWRKHLIREGSPYDSLSPGKREAFVAEVAAAVRRQLDRAPGKPPAPRAAPVTAAREDDHRAAVECHSETGARRRRPADVLVAPRAAEISLDPVSVGLPADARARGEAVPAVERLVEWATGEAGTPRLCALLGDLGMGKTTTAQLFTERLLTLRKGDKDGDQAQPIPLPVLFDLRDLDVGALPGQPSLPDVVPLLLKAQVSQELTTAQVLETVGRGNCLVIFDGLDEVLVKLDPHRGRLFVRALWQVIDRRESAVRPAARDAEAAGASRPTRLMLTCRTHYFRSIRDEVTSFTGQDRDGPAGRDYLALLMLPFGDQQIREYLKANVPQLNVDTVLALIDSVHNLRELAERPLLLSYVTEQLEFIERAKMDGRTIRPADMYGAMVGRWLARDDSKHILLPDHKVMIMEALAAHLWRGGRASWSAGDLEQWLVEFLHDRPDLELNYGQRQPELWKEDLRTATFLVRRGDDEFSFAHTSLLEYFLSRYLLRALRQGADDVDALSQRWAMPRPSPETLDFLGQGLAGLDPGGWRTCRDALTALAAGYRPGSSELAFAYGLAAAGAGQPHHRLGATRLAGADLRGWQIGPPPASAAGQTPATDLDLSGAVLAGADLSGSRFQDVNLTGADLSRADLTRTRMTGCNLRNADLTDSVLVGTVLRACRLDGARTAGSAAYRAQALLCEPARSPAAPGWLHGPGTEAPAGQGRLVALTGHTAAVRSVAYQPDGTRLATASNDGTVRIWDTATGQHLHTLTGHDDWVLAVAYQPDGTRLATASNDRTVRIWDTATGQHLHTLTGHDDWVLAVAYQPDGTRLATASNDRTVRIWDTATGKHLHTLTGHDNWVQAVAYQPDGTRLATASNDRTVRIWDTATGKHLHTLTGHDDWVQAVAYQPDGTRLATASYDRTVRIWDTATGQHLHTLTGHTAAVRSVAYQPDGTRLATASDDGTVRIWDTATGKHLHTLTGHDDWVQAVAYQPDGTRLATASNDRTVRIWDTATGQHLHTLTGHTTAVLAVAYQPDGTRLATASNDRTVRIWDTATGQHLHTLTGHDDWVLAVAYQPDGTRLATASNDGTVRIWDTATGQHLHTLTGHTTAVLAVAYQPDGTRLATASNDGTVRIWDTATGQHLHTLTGHTTAVLAVAYQPDGTRLATASNDRTVRIWDTATGQHLHTLTGHTTAVLAVAYQPDGTRLATASNDRTVRIWDTATGKHLHTLTGHDDWVLAVAYQPDGTRLATASNDRTVRIWDTATGKHLHTLTGHDGGVLAVAYQPDGTRLATASNDGTVRIWDTATGKQADWYVEHLPGQELALWRAETGDLYGATSGAWEWLGWVVMVDHTLTRLPAETYGPLPAMPGPGSLPSRRESAGSAP